MTHGRLRSSKFLKDSVNYVTEGTVASKIEAPSQRSERMKTYATATDALIDYLHYLDECGGFNSVTLSQRMRDANVPADDMISESLFRMLRLGNTTRLVEHRAVAACRVFGIEVTVRNGQIPDGWTRKKSQPSKR